MPVSSLYKYVIIGVLLKRLHYIYTFQPEVWSLFLKMIWMHIYWQGTLLWLLLRYKSKMHIELPYDTAIPLLGIYSEKTIIWKDTCTPMFTAALFTIAKTWKQPKCPSTDEQIKKMWYTYTVEHYSAIKKNEKCYLDRKSVV